MGNPEAHRSSQRSRQGCARRAEMRGSCTQSGDGCFHRDLGGQPEEINRQAGRHPHSQHAQPWCRLHVRQRTRKEWNTVSEDKAAVERRQAAHQTAEAQESSRHARGSSCLLCWDPPQHGVWRCHQRRLEQRVATFAENGRCGFSERCSWKITHSLTASARRPDMAGSDSANIQMAS